MKVKLVRITTAPISLTKLLAGQLGYMKRNGYEVYAASSAGSDVALIKSLEGVSHTTFPFTRKYSPLQDLLTLFQLTVWLTWLRPTIVHTHTPKAGLLGMFAAKVARVPIRIHTVAGLPEMTAQGISKLVLRTTERITSASATEIWANSTSIKNYLTEHDLCPDSKLEVIGSGSSNGVDLECFKSKPLEGIARTTYLNTIPAGSHIIAFVGRLVVDKGLPELLQAFIRLCDEVPSAYLLLAGELESIRSTETLSSDIIHTIQKHSNILTLGWIDDVAVLLTSADLLVHPSHREGFPNVILQAHASALPVVCSEIPGNIDATAFGKFATYHRVGDAKELYSAMRDTLFNLDDARERAKAAQQWVAYNFDRKNVHRAISEAYERRLASLS